MARGTIHIDNVSKTFWLKGRPHRVLDGISLTIPPRTGVALLGRNGAGKSTLLSMIAGGLAPDSGRIVTDGSVSWPVGFSGSFHRDLSGAQNTRFVARIYGVDTEALSDFVEEFAELGEHYHLPIRSYSSGMRSRLSFGVSMGIAFDTYLIDEVTSVGDAAFKSKSSVVLRDRLRDSGAIMVSHSMAKLRQICTKGAVIEKGRLWWYEDIEDAIAHHQANMKRRLGRDVDDEDVDDD
ncbi:MAG: ABC transporter ATP-binding protein [Alkalilacustris sp.]